MLLRSGLLVVSAGGRRKHEISSIRSGSPGSSSLPPRPVVCCRSRRGRSGPAGGACCWVRPRRNRSGMVRKALTYRGRDEEAGQVPPDRFGSHPDGDGLHAPAGGPRQQPAGGPGVLRLSMSVCQSCGTALESPSDACPGGDDVRCCEACDGPLTSFPAPEWLRQGGPHGGAVLPGRPGGWRSPRKQPNIQQDPGVPRKSGGASEPFATNGSFMDAGTKAAPTKPRRQR